jgi:hypothetical protein
MRDRSGFAAVTVRVRSQMAVYSRNAVGTGVAVNQEGGLRIFV